MANDRPTAPRRPAKPMMAPSGPVKLALGSAPRMTSHVRSTTTPRMRCKSRYSTNTASQSRASTCSRLTMMMAPDMKKMILIMQSPRQRGTMLHGPLHPNVRVGNVLGGVPKLFHEGNS